MGKINIIFTKKEADLLYYSSKKYNSLNANPPLDADGEREVLQVSFDLGQSKEAVLFEGNAVLIRDLKLNLKDFYDLKEEVIYTVIDYKITPVVFFSKETNFYYKLLPTRDWPTITFSSTPMHRFATVTPKESAYLMVGEIDPIEGRILDTCCGLGYTATLCAESPDCKSVDTYEKDKNVLTLASYNPYSKLLFNGKNPKLTLHRENIIEAITKLKSNTYERVIHDPPTPKYTPELYSEEFQKQLLRVLRYGGILYHYCPTPDKHKGRLLYPRLIRQLKNIGFIDVEYHEASNGIRAVKK